jgi:oxalate decarboxylase/phosphoglucose isomerase-like protein (cupin superfamily)
MKEFDLFGSHLHLDARGDALLIKDSGEFWGALMSADLRRPEIARVANEPGYLVAAFHMHEDTAHWERHPAGDEVICVMSGRVDFVLDEPQGERVIALQGRQSCVVPKGVWHRIVVREPSDVLFITFGLGTEHKSAT